MDGQVLQLRRRKPEGYWQSVTGSLLEGETPMKAALREVREETGLPADEGLGDTGITNRYPIHPAWRDKFAPSIKENTEYVFSLLLHEAADISLNPGEHVEYRWLPREMAAAHASSSTDRDAILELVTTVSGEA